MKKLQQRERHLLSESLYKFQQANAQIRQAAKRKTITKPTKNTHELRGCYEQRFRKN